MLAKVWRRSPRWYWVFLVVGTLLSIPLAGLTLYFEDDPQRGWVSSAAMGMLILFGLIGAARGFYVYIILKEPVDME